MTFLDTRGFKPALMMCLLVGLYSPTALAKPIAYQGASTAMFEYGAGSMIEAQAFYAPRYWLSAGGGWVRFEADDDAFRREISYARVNALARRWNLPGAQGNVFVWGGIGSATGNDFSGRTATPSAGFSADYETLRFYSSLRSEYHYSREFKQRMDTLQLGFAPYAHDYDRLATWLLLQARHATRDLMRDEVEFAAMLRLFKGTSWVEAGLTQNGRLQTMLMFTF